MNAAAHMTHADYSAVIVYVLAALIGSAITFGVSRGIKLLRTGYRMLTQMHDDFMGRPGRPGVDRVPGLMERMKSVEIAVGDIQHELKPNSGGSTRDLVNVLYQHATGEPAPESKPVDPPQAQP